MGSTEMTTNAMDTTGAGADGMDTTGSAANVADDFVKVKHTNPSLVDTESSSESGDAKGQTEGAAAAAQQVAAKPNEAQTEEATMKTEDQGLEMGSQTQAASSAAASSATPEEQGRGRRQVRLGQASNAQTKSAEHAALREKSMARSNARKLQEWRVPVNDKDDIKRVLDDLTGMYGKIEANEIGFADGGMVLTVWQYVCESEVAEAANKWIARK